MLSKNFKNNIKFEDINLLIISSLVLGVLTTIIQLDLISTPRIYAMSQQEFNDTYSKIFSFFSEGGGFFIDPIYANIESKKFNGITI